MGGWGRRSASAIILAEVVMAVEYGKTAPVLPDMMKDLGFGMGFGGLLMLGFGAASLVLALPSAALASHVGHRRLVLGSLCIAIAGNVLGIVAFGCADAVARMLLCASRVAEGVGYCVVTVCGPAVISAWFPPRRRGIRMGAWGASVALGMLVATSAAPVLADLWGWRSLWALSLFGAVLALVAAALLLRMPAKSKRPERAAPSMRRIAEGATPCALLIACMYCALNFGFDTFNDFSITYLIERLSLSTDRASIVFALGCVTMMLGSLLGGVGIARASRRERLLCLTMAMALVCFFLQFRLEGDFAAQAAYQGLAALVYGSLPAMLCFLAPESARDPRGSDVSVGIMVFGQNVGTLVGPFACGLIIDHGGWVACSNAVFSVFLVGMAASIAFSVLWRHGVSRRRDAGISLEGPVCSEDGGRSV